MPVHVRQIWQCFSQKELSWIPIVKFLGPPLVTPSTSLSISVPQFQLLHLPYHYYVSIEPHIIKVPPFTRECLTTTNENPAKYFLPHHGDHLPETNKVQVQRVSTFIVIRMKQMKKNSPIKQENPKPISGAYAPSMYKIYFKY
jgi:hypothetical protein